MRILLLIAISSIQLTAAAVGFFLLLIGMNGYSERQATPSLILYLVLSLASALGLGVGGVLVVKRLVKRKTLGRVAAAAVSVVGSSVLGFVVLVAAMFMALALAEVLRGMK